MLRVHWDLHVSIALCIIQEYILNEIANSKRLAVMWHQRALNIIEIELPVETGVKTAHNIKLVGNKVSNANSEVNMQLKQ